MVAGSLNDFRPSRVVQFTDHRCGVVRETAIPDQSQLAAVDRRLAKSGLSIQSQLHAIRASPRCSCCQDVPSQVSSPLTTPLLLAQIGSTRVCSPFDPNFSF